jgi:hypothetical protein
MNLSRWGLLAVVAAYLVIGALYAIYTPPWQAPDEPAHYNYIRALATTGHLPQMQTGDYDQGYLTQIVFEQHFPPDMSIAPLTYEDWQPPLYYALAAPLFGLTGGSLLALRLFSVALGAGIVILAFLLGRESRGDDTLALGAAAFVAFVPQHVAILASVNNDGLAELLLAAVMYGLVKFQPGARTWPLGLWLGLGLVTKLSCYIAVPLALLAYIQTLWPIRPGGIGQGADGIGNRPAGIGNMFKLPPRAYSALGVIFIPLLVALPWWGRNLVLYGWPDVLGQLNHNRIVMGQITSAQWIAQYGWGSLLGRFFTFTFQSFWGQFGWMTTPLPPRYYAIVGALALAALAGWGAAAWAQRATLWRDRRVQLLGAWVGLTVLMYLYYNLNFVQHQGRYLFPALIPLGLAFTIGLAHWAKSWRGAVLAALYGALAVLDIVILFRVIVPALSF